MQAESSVSRSQILRSPLGRLSLRTNVPDVGVRISLTTSMTAQELIAKLEKQAAEAKTKQGPA